MNTSENLNKIMYGNDASKKIELLKNNLLQIEKKHTKYFENKPSRLNLDKSDRLHNHYIMIIDSNGIKFSFITESNLEENIKNECLDTFNIIFNSKN